MHQLSIIRRESVDTVRVILDLCRLGYRHDLHGRCPELPGAVCHAVLSREWMRLVVGLKFHHGMAESGLYVPDSGGDLSGSEKVAGSFSGLLAYAIGFMDGICGYSGWRWIFIL
jgi:hypothetical protein